MWVCFSTTKKRICILNTISKFQVLMRLHDPFLQYLTQIPSLPCPSVMSKIAHSLLWKPEKTKWTDTYFVIQGDKMIKYVLNYSGLSAFLKQIYRESGLLGKVWVKL